jgi:hypothetical protein
MQSQEMKSSELAPDHQRGGQPPATGYVSAPKLLEILFPAECRPSLRWLRDHQRELPHVRLGRLIYFDPSMVKAHLDAKRKGAR